MLVEGRAWTFGDDVSTDAIYPHAAYRLEGAEAARALFGSLRPGWADEVRPGDVIVAGRRFGIGSARPAPVLLRRLGIGACVADSLAALFLRNCINAGLPALPCDGVSEIIADGDVVSVDLEAGIVENRATGARRRCAGLPRELLAVIEGGGLIARLEREGYIAARDADDPARPAGDAHDPARPAGDADDPARPAGDAHDPALPGKRTGSAS
jgi:3-isopropylmalate/(R)-2-methylmalate dehydratase small subunit